MNHRSYLTLAIPLTLSTITTPLLGAVDTAVVGNLPNPSFLAAVAIGTVIFNTIYWLFGFLRISTSGFTAQVSGTNNEKEQLLVFTRPFLLAILIGVAFILFQYPIERLALMAFSTTASVESKAIEYFRIRIWGTPFALVNYVILGWLIGMAKIKLSLVLQVFMNLTNIILDLFFVYVFSMDVKGVAVATLLAEIIASIAGIIIILKISSFRFNRILIMNSFDLPSLKKMMSVNRDLFIRTICLLLVFNLFTAKGAALGTETLAANAVLLQIHYLMAYVFDGFANASGIYTGKAVGTHNLLLFRQTIKLSCIWAVIISVVMTIIYYGGSGFLIQIFTDIPSVIVLAETYNIWLLLFPISASFGLILYGVFTGATEVGPVRNSIFIAFLAYLGAIYAFVPEIGGHGLWLSFIIFTVCRSLFLMVYLPVLERNLFIKTNQLKVNKLVKDI
nr:MATE family efflux transporter [Neobacillus sp. Marseille-Q6967]